MLTPSQLKNSLCDSNVYSEAEREISTQIENSNEIPVKLKNVNVLDTKLYIILGNVNYFTPLYNTCSSFGWNLLKENVNTDRGSHTEYNLYEI